MSEKASRLFLIGILGKGGPDICQDGADFVLEGIAPPGKFRLLPATAEVRREIEAHLGRLCFVLGTPKPGLKPGCEHIEVWAIFPSTLALGDIVPGELPATPVENWIECVCRRLGQFCGSATPCGIPGVIDAIKKGDYMRAAILLIQGAACWAAPLSIVGALVAAVIVCSAPSDVRLSDERVRQLAEKVQAELGSYAVEHLLGIR